LPELAPRNVSYITAYPLHPQHTQGDVEFPAQLPYTIPIRDAGDDSPFDVTISFRSTMKKLQIRRVGQLGGIEGSGKLRQVDGVYRLEGQLTNGTGSKLRNVYMIYHDREREDDYILFQPAWEPGVTIDLSVFDGRSTKLIGGTGRDDQGPTSAIPENKVPIRGPMGKPGQDAGWSRYWYQSLRSSGFGNANVDDLDKEVKKTIVMMSIFQRLPPMRNLLELRQGADRVEVLRRGGRYLDMSNAVASGKIVVIAEADGQTPLPYPFEVSGEKVAGKGLVFYQYALPLTRIDEPAATQPGDNAQPAAEGKTLTLPSPGVPGEGTLAASASSPSLGISGVGTLAASASSPSPGTPGEGWGEGPLPATSQPLALHRVSVRPAAKAAGLAINELEAQRWPR
jgi:hypothetical protein